MKRVWKVFKYAALALVALASVGLLWLAVANFRANGRLSAKLSELRDRGLPTSLADLKRPVPPPETNAVTCLREATAAVTAIARGVDAVCEAEGPEEYDRLWAGRPSPAVLKAIRELMVMHPKAIPLLIRAAASKDYDWQYDYDAGTKYLDRPDSIDQQMIDQTGYKRDVFRVLYYQVVLLVSEKKPEEALRLCQAMLRLVGFYGQDPFLLNYGLANAMYGLVTASAINQALRCGPSSPEAHQELEHALAQDDLAAQFDGMLASERAFTLQSFDEMRADLRAGFTRFPSFKDDVVTYLNVFDRFAVTADSPVDRKLQDEWNGLQHSGGPFTSLIAPAILSSRIALARTQAMQRSLRVLNQLLLDDPQGEKGTTLEQLRLPADVKTDPFGGQPLHLKHTAEGWVVYSIGNNLRDDGGKLDDDETDIGVGPIDTRPTTAAQPVPESGN
jgi:hypothetical protein